MLPPAEESSPCSVPGQKAEGQAVWDREQVKLKAFNYNGSNALLAVEPSGLKHLMLDSPYTVALMVKFLRANTFKP